MGYNLTVVAQRDFASGCRQDGSGKGGIFLPSLALPSCLARNLFAIAKYAEHFGSGVIGQLQSSLPEGDVTL